MIFLKISWTGEEILNKYSKEIKGDKLLNNAEKNEKNIINS